MLGDDQGICPSSDLEPYEDWGVEGWLVPFWNCGTGCHYTDWDDGVEHARFNVRRVKD
jgi:hypothetical protein